MPLLNPKQFLILGITSNGKVFRPSDWIDRLCGVMSSFRPADDTGDHRYTHSPYVRPEMFNGERCVLIDERLCEIDPRALDFVFSFAKDNDLVLSNITDNTNNPTNR